MQLKNGGIMMKSVFKILLKVVLIFVIVEVVFYILFFASIPITDKSNDENDYETYLNEVKYANNHMPALADLANYEEISINRKTKKYLLWKRDSISLKVSYNEAAFEEAVKSIQSKYSFVTKDIEDMDDYSASIEGYSIGIVSKKETYESHDFYDYPKGFLMIGVNENNNSILYLFHYDFDLDEIDNLDSFIKKNYLLK